MKDVVFPKPEPISRWLTLLAASVLVALFVAFVILRLVTPSDGARLRPGTSAWMVDGVIVTPLEEGSDGLQAGDIVIAVEGIALEMWADDILTRDLPRPDWSVGERAYYDVRRGDSEQVVETLLRPYPIWQVVRADWGTLVFAMVNLMVALFAFVQRPDDSAVRVLLLGASCLLAASTWSIGLQASDFVYRASFILYQLTTIFPFSLVWAFLLHFVLVFPKPQPWLVDRRWVVSLIYLVPIVVNAIWVTVTPQAAPSRLAWFSQLGSATAIIQLVFSVLTVAGAVLAVRNARDPVSRAQIRWVFFALVAAITFGLVVGLIPELLTGEPFLSMNVAAVFGLIIPISIVVAIFRYQLFSIDIIIRRTTQYAVVTILLALVYLATVVALQSVFTSLTGQTSSLAIVLSTLLIAALFLPLRQRVQDWIDRRFYRSKYDAQKTLEAFAATVRDETDLDALTAELVRVIQETMQPEHVTVWLAPERSDELPHTQ